MTEPNTPFRENPLIARLQESGAENATSFFGFLGPSDREGYVRLYPKLGTLSRSIEIPRDDIVGSTEVPGSGLGAAVVWVRNDAEVIFQSAAKAEKYDTPIAQKMRRVQRGGLRMMARGQTRDDCHGPCSQSTCEPCACVCKPTCQSECQPGPVLPR
ncbi:hypothetical protein [Nocardia neocaledoniensis]|uniref:hypothetical protein n=1 Tax=Nocardia neocaledoniensis TaxID=236511 RepID=UPI0024554665|nr:hypothetical protein [Nocardia neocaledoniensis]